MNDKPDTVSKSHTLRVNGVDMFFERVGSGYPLILLHGGVGTHKHWDQHVTFLSSNFDLIIPDLRGHGRSTNPSTSLDYQTLADDIAQLIHSLNLNQPFVCGWSDGGQIGLELAIRYRDLVKAFVLGAIVFDQIEESRSSLAKFGIKGPGIVNIEKIKSSFPDWLDMVHQNHQQYENHWIDLLHQISYLWYTEYDYSNALLNQVDCPVLLVIGDHDQFVPLYHIVDLSQLLPNAELAVITNGSHQVDREKPGEFCTLVVDYIHRQLA